MGVLYSVSVLPNVKYSINLLEQIVRVLPFICNVRLHNDDQAGEVGKYEYGVYTRIKFHKLSDIRNSTDRMGRKVVLDGGKKVKSNFVNGIIQQVRSFHLMNNL